MQDVRPGDDGVYSCRAENLLGQVVNKSAKLSVQCKLKYLLYLMHLKVYTLIYIIRKKKDRRNGTRQFMEGNSVQVIFSLNNPSFLFLDSRS